MMESAASWVAIDSLKPWKDNPRKNDRAVDEVAASIKRFGFAAPIVARRADRMVIAGHTRLKAAQKLGLDRVPVRFVDLDPADAKLLALADNKLGEIAEWDDELLAKVLGEFDEAQLEGVGFDAAEIDKLIQGEAVGVEEDEPPEMDEQGEPDSKTGEVYELGPHRLVCGDARSADTYKAVMIDGSADLAFTSPPYAQQRTYDQSSGFEGIPPDGYVAWFKPVADRVESVLADSGSWCVNIKEHAEDGQLSLYVKDLVIAHARDWGWRFVEEYVWTHGGTPRDPSRRFKNGFEPIFHFTRSPDFGFFPNQCRHASDSLRGDYRKRKRSAISTADCQGATGDIFANPEIRTGLAYPSNVVSAGKNNEALGHPAAFGMGLPSFFIRALTRPNDVVLDPFGGSGTTLIACAELGRVCRMIELSPRYCDVIRKRWTRWAREHSQDPGPGALDG